jgi:hypothetical protein
LMTPPAAGAAADSMRLSISVKAKAARLLRAMKSLATSSVGSGDDTETG